MSRAEDLRAAWGFLTPLGAAATPSPGALDWFPVVGAGLGAGLGVTWWVAAKVLPPGPAAAVVVAADLAVTGLLHFDGLVDAADGLLAPMDRARRLAVMASPEVGAFGLGVGAAALLARWSALAAMSPSVPLLAALWSTSRLAMVVTARTEPYARPEGGLATAFLAGPGARSPGIPGLITGISGLAAVVVAGRSRARRGSLAVVASMAAAGAVVVMARRRLGGFTGDVLGAAGMLGETVGLVVAAAR